MDKFDCQELVNQFSILEFLEHMEQLAHNNGAMAFAAIVSKPVRRGAPHHHQSPAPIMFPKTLAKAIYEFLIDYKYNLAAMLEDMVIVDRSVLPEEPDDEEGDEGEDPEGEEPEEGDDEDDGDEDDVFFNPGSETERSN